MLSNYKKRIWKLINKEKSMEESEMARVQRYLQDKFGNDSINVKERPQSDGSVEVYPASCLLRMYP